MSDIEQLEARVAQLERLVEHLEAERGILDTLHRKAQAIDYGKWDDWLDCYTEDAVFQMVEVRGTERTTNVRHKGHEALSAFIVGHTAAPERFHKHVVLETVITDLEGPSARATSYFTRLDGGPDGPYIWSFGRYFDLMRRGDDGRWRVAERTLEVESRARPVDASVVAAKG